MAQKLQWTSPLLQSVLIVSGLFVWCFYLALHWISLLPVIAQMLLGLSLGLTSMASFSTTQTQRSRYRRITSVNLAQLSRANTFSLRRFTQSREKVLSWLPDPSDAELVRWINVGLEKAWPLFKEASSGLIETKLEAVLNKYRVGVVKQLLVGKVDLGIYCPYIQGVRALPSDEDNKVCLEIQLDWRQNKAQEISVHVLTSGPEYVVKVKHFVIYCVLRLTFSPLMAELPCFGALVISITEPPLIDFQSRVVSGDVKKLPGVQNAVDNTFVAALMDLLVWPSRVIVPFLPGNYSNLEPSCVGHLHVHLVEAKELVNKDILGRSDPYVVLYVRRRTDLIEESSQMHDTSEPIWNEKFLFKVQDSDAQKLTIKVMDVDGTQLDVFVGTAELAINQLEPNSQEDLWIDLVGDPSRLRGKCAGKIHLLVEFKPLNLPSEGIDPSGQSSVPMTQPAGESLSAGRSTHLRGAHSIDGLRAVLDGQDDICGKVIYGVVAPSPSDSSLLNREQVVCADTKAEPRELAEDDELLYSQEDKTDMVQDDIGQPASRKEAMVTRTTEPHGTLTESHRGSQQSAMGFSERSSSYNTEKMPKVEMVEDKAGDDDVGKDEMLLKGPNVIAGDPAWGLNGLSLEHCNSSVISEAMFSSEIFEVD